MDAVFAVHLVPLHWDDERPDQKTHVLLPPLFDLEDCGMLVVDVWLG